MQLPRRRFLKLAAGAAALPPTTRALSAPAYPARAVRILVGYTAGGVSDILARLIGQKLSQRLGQPFVVEDRPGAGSNIATEAAVRARADGYTLLLVGIANAINVTLYENLSFSFMQDIAPVAMIGHGPLVMEVHPSVPASTVPEFIAYAKNNPGRINMASAGTGGVSHLAGELFKMMAGVSMQHVPYHGSPPALADLLAGQVQVMFDNMASSIELIRAGKLRPLAVTTAARSQALPEVPTIAEFVAGYAASGWNGLGAPRNCPAEIIETLNRVVNSVLADPQTTAQLAELGSSPAPGSPAEFGRLIAADTEKWAKVVKATGVQPE